MPEAINLEILMKEILNIRNDVKGLIQNTECNLSKKIEEVKNELNEDHKQVNQRLEHIERKLKKKYYCFWPEN